MNRYHKSQGFTLIELLFAMSFVSVLLIVILTSTIYITRIYNKGITLKQVNQSGAQIGNELQTSLKAADAPLATDYVHNAGNNGGRLCLGSYSYVWNLGSATTNRYDSGSDTIGLVKVDDPTRDMCSSATRAVPRAKATELIRGAGGSAAGVHLVLRDFTISDPPSAVSGINYIYTVTYTVSTDDDTLIEATADGGNCKGGSDDEFCALNRFSFQVFMRVGGGGKS